MGDRWTAAVVAMLGLAAVTAPVVLILTGHRDDVIALAPSVAGVLSAVVVALGQSIRRTVRETQRLAKETHQRTARIERALNGSITDDDQRRR